jgi:hypothetical protein
MSLPILPADDDFIEYLQDQEITTIELEDILDEYADWEQDNVTLLSRLLGRLRRLKSFI